MFDNCPMLKQVELGNISRIGEDAFAGCTGLQHLYINAKNPPEIQGNKPFEYNVYTQATLYVPNDNNGGYRYEIPWRDFQRIETIDFSGIDNVIAGSDSDVCDIFSTAGTKLATAVNSREWLDKAAAGVYILRFADGNARKVSVSR